MVKVLLDTNILIDYLNGLAPAKIVLERYADKAISLITWMEVMIGSSTENRDATKQFLTNFELLAIDDAVAVQAVVLRQTHKIKLPDAIIWASAQTQQRLLLTRNTKDFAENEVGVVVPYRV